MPVLPMHDVLNSLVVQVVYYYCRALRCVIKHLQNWRLE